ncbi:hypothetical protein PIB30_040985 [Stylosanthes scabra]|uniref:Uncharacterized protein n=1 Tax=Stylosanthes scabra TaxID=79078 RepID=A0ABU6VD21_9FABA|nr:hypothetical protein [Stylosanthes scabra]
MFLLDVGANIGVENDFKKRELDELDNEHDDFEKNVISSTSFGDDLDAGEKGITEDGLKSENIRKRKEAVNDGAFMEESSKTEVNVILGNCDGEDGGKEVSDGVNEVPFQDGEGQ